MREKILNIDINLADLPIGDLRGKWEELCGYKLPDNMGRGMLEKSIEYKLQEKAGFGLNPEQQKQLNKLVEQYKRNPKCFDNKQAYIKPGTRLVKVWQGKRHSINVLPVGFEYNGNKYSSLSQIAYDITGTRWNGWVFFGLKKRGRSS